MSLSDQASDLMNCFALVTYIPDPLGAFLDRLRLELVPGCLPRGHVTVLPPRPLFEPPRIAIEELSARIPELPAFDLEAEEVRVFETTSVIYLQVGRGWPELQRMHSALNSGTLEFSEPFPYHPHVTLAQDIRADEVPLLKDLAQRRWRDYRGPRSFTVETLSFVQNTVQNRWLDLAHWSLGAVPTGVERR